MCKEVLTFGIEKNIFNRHKIHVPLKDVDTKKLFVCKKISFGEKKKKFKPLHIMLPKTGAYIKSLDGQSKWMYFLIEYDEYL